MNTKLNKLKNISIKNRNKRKENKNLWEDLWKEETEALEWGEEEEGREMKAGRREREHVEGGRGKNKECKGNKEMRKDRGGRKDGQFPPPVYAHCFFS